jgi:hypothetical protein
MAKNENRLWKSVHVISPLSERGVKQRQSEFDITQSPKALEKSLQLNLCSGKKCKSAQKERKID